MAVLILLYIVVCCLSLFYVMQQFYHHLAYDPGRLLSAVVVMAAVAPVLLLFTFAEFSFGYFLGFYFSSMVVGYLWLSFFSNLQYDRQLAGLSAAVSLIGFLLPALFVSAPFRQMRAMSLRVFDRLLIGIFLVCLVMVAIGAGYNFRFVSPGDASNLRGNSLPTLLVYFNGVATSSLLPFLFACFVARHHSWRAGAALVLLFLYYPVSTSKVALFAPAWLVLMLVFSRSFGARIAVVLSLLLPALAGVILFFLYRNGVLPSQVVLPYFLNVNLRVVAIPSIALDIYNAFFSSHPLTYFCQIRVLKSAMDCPYQDQLSIVMANNYPFGGNLNASLFATEGIASLGPWLAPISVLAGGLIIALANRLSACLPPWFVLVSGAILVQVMLNIPLSTALLSHGAGFLFFLWYITPRSMFEPGASSTCALR
ncbi:hypothetical protein [Bradyrhizobium sp.]|uniref:hypothetical protein n=1 Tax=Bradyrhizobium sp. TaxID=376 RepID=UPI0027354E4C|nr:hypothetical protein [Bradyrhizobium sp.]MDP3075375.1 hypothetical protein [Bradyrhizobium sp.]